MHLAVAVMLWPMAWMLWRRVLRSLDYPIRELDLMKFRGAYVRKPCNVAQVIYLIIRCSIGLYLDLKLEPADLRTRALG